MLKLAKYRVLFTLGIFLAILAVAGAAIFWARGFKPDLKNHRLSRTGLIVATSIPTGANVYLDGRLTSATDTNIAFLDPKTYKVKIEKEGYIPWEKDIEIKADLATEIKAALFPTAPEIKPLTTSGAADPVISPDSTKLVYGVAGPTGGTYVLPMSDRPFPFRQGARLLVKNTPSLDFSQAKFIWSPDSKQIIARFETQDGQPLANILLDADRTEQDLRDITASQATTLNNWQDDLITRSQTQAISVPQSIKDATASANPPAGGPSPSPNSPIAQSPTSPIAQLPTPPTGGLNYYPTGLIFSPDEEKILYKTRDNKYKVYDLKEKKEYALPDFADFITISWYPDSNHLVVAQKNLISVIEVDGKNIATVYSGKFEDGFVFAHPSASRIIILTALTQREGTPPNLYSINLR